MLSWLVTSPDPRIYGPGPWPAVLVVHGGGFTGGGPADTALEGVDPDLAAHGFIAFSVTYRLAPPGTIEGQPPHRNGKWRPINPDSGRPPEQTDDIKLECLAARADPRCDGRVGIVGDSAGGSHAAFVAADTTAGPIVSNPSQQWNPSTRPDVVASLSGAYEFADRTPDRNLQGFIQAIQTYTDTRGRSGLAYQASVSPAAFVNRNARPMILFTSELDAQPIAQYFGMIATLKNAKATNYQAYQVPGAGHAFEYWSSPVSRVTPQLKVRDVVLRFFDDAFAAVRSR